MQEKLYVGCSREWGFEDEGGWNGQQMRVGDVGWVGIGVAIRWVRSGRIMGQDNGSRPNPIQTCLVKTGRIMGHKMGQDPT